jgi:hypothetical protein
MTRIAVAVCALSLGACAAMPNSGTMPAPKQANAYATDKSFAAAAALNPSDNGWPADQWWKFYGDAQLDRLVDEALAGSPSIAVAQARLQRAQAQAQVAGAAGKPQVSANASVTEQKQSYNYLTPRAMTPQGWNDYGRATLDLSWELDFWGRNRAALAAATSDAEAARADAAQARLALSAAIASSYAELAREFAALDTAEAALKVRAKTDSRPWAACSRSNPAGRPLRLTCSPFRNRSPCSATPSPRCSVPGRIAASRSNVRRCGSLAASACPRNSPPTCSAAAPISSPRGCGPKPARSASTRQKRGSIPT